MNLDKALNVLADTFTDDDDLTGFVVHSSPRIYGRWTESDYIEAWEAVRKHINRNVNPRPQETAASD